MSNPHNKTSSKVIGIKPITFPKFDDGVESATEGEQLEGIEDQIANKEAELNELREKIQIERKEADHAIEQAKKDWEDEKQKLIKETREQGFEQGFQEGKTEAESAFRAKLDQANHVIEQAYLEHETIINQSEPIILDLAVKVARKIVAKEVEQNDGYLTLLKKAIEDVHDQPSIKIHTSSSMYEYVRSNQDQLMTLLDANIVLSIHPSVELNHTDCVIETPFSRLDVSIDQQFTKLQHALKETAEAINRGD
ncbi:flagellar assembly protein FliH [Pelagirhabdus alkalitolerans]|uniref:flagellar assembly protein FliH n=1 Tax=Pelagirhabdus alkalitolerans TaxID=1612202 RepID=UPI0015A3A465|nr:flagellar assembly protein FliH [Pelagirhabdus alkalitolerans]